MWRNAEALDFVGWLRAHNDRRPPQEAVGFYGLDLYSLYASVDEVIAYLEDVDPAAAVRAGERYACFERFGGEQTYGRAVSLGISDSCRQGVIAQLTDLQRQAAAYLRRDGLAAEAEQFYAEQNARLIAHAEQYYRSMFADRDMSWDLRDRHMADTLARLSQHLAGRGGSPRIVVWAHNSHVGDARMTEMSRRGQLNLGQLAREHWPEEVALVGFTTFTGSVTAASNWDSPAERKQVRPALPGSYEALFHEMGEARVLFDLTAPEAVEALLAPMLERAIGVIYRPETERASHYVSAMLAGQFDAVIHIDETRAVEPLERTAGWEAAEPPETYPSAL
jgi:erythromycin esterase-like protein